MCNGSKIDWGQAAAQDQICTLRKYIACATGMTYIATAHGEGNRHDFWGNYMLSGGNYDYVLAAHMAGTGGGHADVNANRGTRDGGS